MDWGAGAPSSLPGVPGGTPYDWGAGSPSPAYPWTGPYTNTGSGSPFAIIGAIVGEGSILPDEGGELVRLIGTGWPTQGPYAVRLIDAVGGVWPVDRDCYGAVMGQGSDIYLQPSGSEIVFASPPCPPGTYDVRLQWGEADEYTADDVLEVVVRNRDAQTYRLRSLLPPQDGTQSPGGYATGPGRLFDEPEADAEAEFPSAALLTLLHVYGQTLQEEHGVPMTRLTQAVQKNDTTINVESTLAFPDAGAFYLGVWRFVYTSKTNSTLIGAVSDVQRFVTIPDGSEVVLDARAILPT
jgi:hypothetical protein